MVCIATAFRRSLETADFFCITETKPERSKRSVSGLV